MTKYYIHEMYETIMIEEKYLTNIPLTIMDNYIHITHTANNYEVQWCSRNSKSHFARNLLANRAIAIGEHHCI